MRACDVPSDTREWQHWHDGAKAAPRSIGDADGSARRIEVKRVSRRGTRATRIMEAELTAAMKPSSRSRRDTAWGRRIDPSRMSVEMYRDRRRRRVPTARRLRGGERTVGEGRVGVTIDAASSYVAGGGTGWRDRGVVVGAVRRCHGGWCGWGRRRDAVGGLRVGMGAGWTFERSRARRAGAESSHRRRRIPGCRPRQHESVQVALANRFGAGR